MEAKPGNAVNGPDLPLYAGGSFGTGVFQTVPTILLLYYCTQTLEIAAGVAGALILMPKLISMAWDPYVGVRSDRSTSSWGRRRPFMALGLVTMTGTFMLLFSAPSLSAIGTATWVGAAYMLMTLGYSLFAVPYIALPAQLSANVEELGKLVSLRMTVVMLGILAGAMFAPWLVEAAGGGRNGYRSMGVVVGLVCAVTMIMPIVLLRNGRDALAVAHSAETTVSVLSDLKVMLIHAPFRYLAFTYLFLATAFGAFSALTPYLVTVAFGRSTGEIGTALGAYLIATLVAVPFWSRLGITVGWKRSLSLAAVGYVLGIIAIGGTYMAGLGWHWTLLFFALAGVPFAGLQVAPFTMMGLLVRQQAPGSEGGFTGLWTAIEKLGLALGPAVAGLALSAVGTGNPVGIVTVAMVLPSLILLASLIIQRIVS